MSNEVEFGYLFGYTTLVRDGDTFVALRGETAPELRVGMQVVLLGDSRGYVPSGFHHGQEVRIVGFVEPFKNGGSDNIIEVADGKHEGWVKPSNIQRAINGRPKGTMLEERHLEMRKRVYPARADLLDAVYLGMAEARTGGAPK